MSHGPREKERWKKRYKIVLLVIVQKIFLAVLRVMYLAATEPIGYEIISYCNNHQVFEYYGFTGLKK